MRWNPYFRSIGDAECSSIWQELSTEPSVLVLGGGFDPRVTRSLRLFTQVAERPVDAVRIGLGSGGAVPDLQELAEAQGEIVHRLVSEAGGSVVDHPYPDVRARRSAGVTISRAFHEAGYLDRYRQIFVDISGLPRSVYFPLVRGLLQASDGEWKGDVHVVACESIDVDRALVEEGAEEAGPLGGFAGPVDEAGWAATVWVPVLGEGMVEQLSSLLDAIAPDEVVPVLPFPSADPRRGDDLVLEHEDLLRERMSVEPRNYLFAAEDNPFDLYRAVSELYGRYQASLRPLGAARFVLSTHSSKVLSIGVLLAAYELGLQVMHVSPSRYGMRAGADWHELAGSGYLTDLWIAGEPYK